MRQVDKAARIAAIVCIILGALALTLALVYTESPCITCR